jgi:hypothetical protein
MLFDQMRAYVTTQIAHPYHQDLRRINCGGEIIRG